MMGTIVRTTTTTAGRSLARLAIIGGAVFLGYKLLGEFPSYRADRASEKRAEEVIAAIGDATGDLAPAQTLYDELTTKGLLQDDEAAVLHGKLSAARVAQSKRVTEDAKRAATTTFDQQFSALLTNNELDSALELLAERSESTPAAAPQLSGLRSKVEDLREPNLGKRMQLASIGEKIPLAEDYLRRYPQGPHRQEAATYVLLAAESNFSITLAQPDISTAYNSLIRLNFLFGQYGRPSPGKTGTLDTLLEKADGYLSTFTVVQLETPPVETFPVETPPVVATPEQPPPSPKPAAPAGFGIGSSVWHGLPDARMLPKYLKERNAKFENLTGQVIAIEGDTAYVQFESGTNYSAKWPTAWGWLKSYTDRGSNNVGSYKLGELIPIGVQPPLPEQPPPSAQPPPPSHQLPSEKPEGVSTNAPNLGKQKSMDFAATPTLLEKSLFQLELEKFRQYVGGTRE